MVGEYKSRCPKMRSEFGKSKIPKMMRRTAEAKYPKGMAEARKSKKQKVKKQKVEARKVETQVEDFKPLTGMLEMVAWKCGMCGKDGEAWVEGMVDKLLDVGVEMVRNFVGSVLVLNKRLTENQHDKVGQATLNMMLMEVCDMMVWPGEWYTPCDLCEAEGGDRGTVGRKIGKVDGAEGKGVVPEDEDEGGSNGKCIGRCAKSSLACMKERRVCRPRVW
jgi:hypothetical protein